MATALPQIGQSIGRFQIVAQLGEGGMATVFRAFDTRLERDVALKFIARGRVAVEAADELLVRFEREAKTLAGLSHPNIVKVLEFGEWQGTPYLVLEYVPGGTLKSAVKPPLDEHQAARLLAPISRALAYAHERGLVHRDVKPANILVTAEGIPMLSDFGIAKVLRGETETGLTGTGVGIGTPEYMSPEQGLGQTVDHRSDIYALGVVLYELVTGRRPFQADTPLAVLLKQMQDPLPRPRSFVPGISETVERILFKALAKAPADRYASMNEFARALEQLAAAAPTRQTVRLLPGLALAGISAVVVGGLALTLAALWALPRLSGQPAASLPSATAAPPTLTVAAVLPTSAPTEVATEISATATPAAPGWQQGQIVLSLLADGQPALYRLVPGEPSDLHPLLADSDRPLIGAALSSDGLRVAYEAYSDELTVLDFAFGKGGSPVVGACRAPSWSPDSTRLLCQTRNGSNRVFRLWEADSHTLIQEWPAPAGSVFPMWSPRGDEFVYAVFSGDATSLWRAALDGSGAAPLAESATENYAPAWSPDGEWIAYQSNAGSTVSEVWIMRRDGQDARRLTFTTNGWSRAPSWSPDGRWLAFVSSQSGSAGADYGEVFAVAVEGGDVVQLTDTGGRVYDWRVAWGVAPNAP